MKDLQKDKNEDLVLPKDIPKEFFSIVSKVLNFIEDVDKTKNKK